MQPWILTKGHLLALHTITTFPLLTWFCSTRLNHSYPDFPGLEQKRKQLGTLINMANAPHGGILKDLLVPFHDELVEEARSLRDIFLTEVSTGGRYFERMANLHGQTHQRNKP